MYEYRVSPTRTTVLHAYLVLVPDILLLTVSTLNMVFGRAETATDRSGSGQFGDAVQHNLLCYVVCYFIFVVAPTPHYETEPNVCSAASNPRGTAVLCTTINRL